MVSYATLIRRVVRVAFVAAPPIIYQGVVWTFGRRAATEPGTLLRLIFDLETERHGLTSLRGWWNFGQVLAHTFVYPVARVAFWDIPGWILGQLVSAIQSAIDAIAAWFTEATRSGIGYVVGMLTPTQSIIAALARLSSMTEIAWTTALGPAVSFILGAVVFIGWCTFVIGKPQQAEQLERILDWVKASPMNVDRPNLLGLGQDVLDVLREEKSRAMHRITRMFAGVYTALIWGISKITSGIDLIPRIGDAARAVRAGMHALVRVFLPFVRNFAAHIHHFFAGDYFAITLTRNERVAAGNYYNVSQLSLINDVQLPTDRTKVYHGPVIEMDQRARWYRAPLYRLVTRHLFYRIEAEICRAHWGPQHIFVQKGISGGYQDVFGRTWEIQKSRLLWAEAPTAWIWSSPIAVAAQALRPRPDMNHMALAPVLQQLIHSIHGPLMSECRRDTNLLLHVHRLAHPSHTVIFEIQLHSPQARQLKVPHVETQRTYREPLPGEPYYVSVSRFDVQFGATEQNVATLIRTTLWRYLRDMATTFSWIIAARNESTAVTLKAIDENDTGRWSNDMLDIGPEWTAWHTQAGMYSTDDQFKDQTPSAT